MTMNRADILEEAKEHDSSNNPDCPAKKPVILAVSYGTSCKTSRAEAIGAVENAIAAANTAYEIRRAFTSGIVINNIEERDGEEIDSVQQAFERLIKDGVKKLVVQPTYIMCGNVYDKLVEIADSYRNKFDSLSIGTPLLSDDDDFIKLADALEEEIADYSGDGTAIVFIGHGVKHEKNAYYVKLQNILTAKGLTSCFVTTIKSVPTLDDAIVSIKSGCYKKAVLIPLMLVAGSHAKKDMAGSWKAVLEEEGFKVECILKGLGEIKAVQDIYAAHAKNAIDQLNR